MPIPAGLAAIGKFLGEAALWTLGIEGLTWIGRKIGQKIAARRAAAAAKQVAEAAAARVNIEALAAKALGEIERLRNAIAAAQAAGDVRTARILERQLAQHMEALATLGTAAQIGRERKIGAALQLAGTAALVGFTIEEWRQASMFRENLGIQGRMQEARNALEQQRLAAFQEYINTLKNRMQADEQNRAFWAWYMQQKFALEAMRQEANALRRGLLSARGRAGRASNATFSRLQVEQAKAYTKAVEQAWRAWRAWQEAMAQINVENVKALNEQQLLVLRGRWDAFLKELEHAHKQREIAMKAMADVWEEVVKGNIKYQLEQQKFAHEAQLTAMKESAETAREIIEAQAKVQAAAIEAAGRVREAAEKGFWELINTRYRKDVEALMESYAELNAALKEAARAAKEGKEVELKVAIMTPSGLGFATVRTKGGRIKVDLDKKAREAAIRYRVEHKITVRT
ncbi:MAG: hypothetical protein QXS97_08355 [Desulfurococcus sp.]